MKLIFIIIITFLHINLLYSENADSVGYRIGVNTNKFKNILETIYWNYVDSVDIDYISEEAFKIMLKSLDKNSVYLNQEQLYTRKVNDQGAGVGIGVELRLINDTAVVYYVKEGSPADSVGIRPFDKFLNVDGYDVTGHTIDGIYGMLRGEKNSRVGVTIERAFSNEIRDIEIVRNEVQLSSLNIALTIPGTKTGYISSKNFSKISHEEFLEELNKMKGKKIRGLIIDLRDNPGGFLEQVGLIIDEFLEGGKTISYTKSRNPVYKQTMTSTSGGCCEKIPIVLILNKNSASACELFAGVLQDLDRGVIVGERSFGKSSVQRLWNMNDSTGFQMTVAEYFSPLGRSIDIKKRDSISIDPVLKLSLDDSTYNNISSMINQFGVGTNIPVFYSESGRVILGGGGIFPDYIVDEEQRTLLTNVLNQRSIIFEYVYKYLFQNKSQLEKDYKKDYEKFINNFNVNDRMLYDLKNLSYGKNIWNEEMFQKDKLKIRAYVKAEIGRVLFGNTVYFSVLILEDKWIRKGLDVMPESYIINK